MNMTDGDNSKSKSTLRHRGSNKVAAVDTSEKALQPSSSNKVGIIDTSEEAISSTNAGPSPIHLSAINGDKVELLAEIRSGKWDINEVDQLGRTPLVYGVLGDRVECVALLLKAGADINKHDIDERTALHWAAYQGNHKLVKLLLTKGADKVKRDKEGRTPLHLSTSHDNIKVIDTLLRGMKVQDINLHDNNKVTPLCWSVFYDRIGYTRLLLKHGADPSIMDKESRTVLHWTSQNKDPSILKLLIDVVQTFINWPDNQGRTVLHMTIGRYNIPLIQFLLTVVSVDINAKDAMDRTPLHWAAVLGETDIVSLLLEKGADNMISDNNGVYPLHYAAQTDSHETVVAMLDKEGIKDVPDKEQGTALMWAAVKGSGKVLEMLLEKKCSDVNAVDALTQTALHKCTQSGHLNCVKILIKYGADVNVYDAKHHIPLFYACASGHGDIVKELLSNGSAAHLDDKDFEGRCPIHYAAMVDRTDIIKILLQYNSNANTQDNAGCTPLHFAAYLGFVHCISVLIENGANVDLQDNDGRTALHLACRCGSVDAVKLLVSRFNASVNILAHAGEQLTPLDYAILEDHQDVAFYLHTENDGYTALALKELSATKIQSVWKGYSFRKSFNTYKHLYIKHEISRKTAVDGSNNVMDDNNSDCKSMIAHEDNDSRSESKLSKIQSYSQGDHSNSSTTSYNTLSSKSSTTVEKSKSHDNLHTDIHKPKSNESIHKQTSVNENSSVFKEVGTDHSRQMEMDNVNRQMGMDHGNRQIGAEQGNRQIGIDHSSSKQKVLRKISTSTINRNSQVHVQSKRIHKNSTHSVHSFSRYHQSNSPVSSSSSSEFFTNSSINKKDSERNNLFNKSYSRYISENKDIIKSSSSESSLLFDSRPNKSGVPTYNDLENKHVNVPEAVRKSSDGRKVSSVPSDLTNTTRSVYRDNAPKVRVIQPDTNLEKPWNIYRRDQKRIGIIREKTRAATKIQIAFRYYRSKKYSISNHERQSAPIESNEKSKTTHLEVCKESISHLEDGEKDTIAHIKGNRGSISNVEVDGSELSEIQAFVDSGNPTEENTEEACIQEVAALFIQLAWRQYTKNKLLKSRNNKRNNENMLNNDVDNVSKLKDKNVKNDENVEDNVSIENSKLNESNKNDESSEDTESDQNEINAVEERKKIDVSSDENESQVENGDHEINKSNESNKTNHNVNNVVNIKNMDVSTHGHLEPDTKHSGKNTYKNENTIECLSNNTQFDSCNTLNSPAKRPMSVGKKENVKDCQLSFIQEVYLPGSTRTDGQPPDTIVPLISPVLDPPCCGSPTLSNSTKVRSPKHSKVRSPTTNSQFMSSTNSNVASPTNSNVTSPINKVKSATKKKSPIHSKYNNCKQTPTKKASVRKSAKVK